MQLMAANLIRCIKLVMLYTMRKRIKTLLRRFFEDKREFARLDLDLEAVKKAKKYCTVLIITVYLTLTLTTAGGITLHLKEGKVR